MPNHISIRITSSFSILFCLFFCNPSQAQRVTKKELQDSIIPSFSAYKDNYFITGVPLQGDVTESTADAKYQISFKQLITRDLLPFESHLFFTYTQKAFWNIYDFSSPFEEVNFNPGLGLGAVIYNKNQEPTGLVETLLEHESNGREGTASRSWNSLSFAYHKRLYDRLIMSLKVWIPFGYRSDNEDILKYIGYGEVRFLVDISPKWVLDVTARKGASWNWKGNLQSRLYFQISKSTNQYIMLEWYGGYAESLVNYSQKENMLRIGWAIRSPDLNILRNKRMIRN